MTGSMVRCTVLALLLVGASTPAAEAAVVEHVHTCLDCQQGGQR